MPNERQFGTRVCEAALILEANNQEHTTRPGACLTTKGHTMPNDDIAYLLKFAPKEAYINDLLDGSLYMNAAGYYHGLPVEQGDPLEASLAYGMGVHANWLLPIYCMFMVRETGIVDNAIVITSE